jgi:hypothetical protein
VGCCVGSQFYRHRGSHAMDTSHKGPVHQAAAFRPFKEVPSGTGVSQSANLSLCELHHTGIKACVNLISRQGLKHIPQNHTLGSQHSTTASTA